MAWALATYPWQTRFRDRPWWLLPATVSLVAAICSCVAIWISSRIEVGAPTDEAVLGATLAWMATPIWLLWCLLKWDVKFLPTYGDPLAGLLKGIAGMFFVWPARVLWIVATVVLALHWTAA